VSNLLKGKLVVVYLLTIALGSVGVAVRAFIVHYFGLLGPIAPYWATISINIIGSFFMGILYTSSLLGQPDVWRLWRIPLGVGFLGGLTTFSTFTLDIYRLIEAGTIEMGLFYLFLSIIGGLVALWFGMLCAHYLF
jgi:CrcB protein